MSKLTVQLNAVKEACRGECWNTVLDSVYLTCILQHMLSIYIIACFYYKVFIIQVLITIQNWSEKANKYLQLDYLALAKRQALFFLFLCIYSTSVSLPIVHGHVALVSVIIIKLITWYWLQQVYFSKYSNSFNVLVCLLKQLVIQQRKNN